MTSVNASLNLTRMNTEQLRKWIVDDLVANEMCIVCGHKDGVPVRIMPDGNPYCERHEVRGE